MTTGTFPTKRQAIAILEHGDRQVHALIDPLTRAQRGRHGIGGGEWSPIDLLGHLASWERHALDALKAWEAGERAPIDIALAARGIRGVNAETLASASALRPGEVLRGARRTHRRLMLEIGGLTDDVWSRAPLGRGRSLGLRLGSILGGAGGPYRHADAHLPDLRDFVRAMANE